MASIIISGKTFNSNTISGFAKRAATHTDELQAVANAAAAQAIINGNINWLDTLFACYKLKTGKMSKQGKLVLDYIKYHTVGLVFNEKDYKFKLQREDKRRFADGVIGSDGQTFSMTLAEFETFKKPKNTDAPAKTASGGAVLKRLESISEALANGLTVADPAQADALVAAAKALFMAIDKAAADAAKAAAPDLDKVDQLNGLKASSKEKAAK